MIGLLLNVVNGQVQNSEQKYITKESNGFHLPFHFNSYGIFFLKLCFLGVFYRLTVDCLLCSFDSWVNGGSELETGINLCRNKL